VKKVDDFVNDLEALQLQAMDFLEHARQTQAKEVNKGRLRPKVLKAGQSVMLSTQYIQPEFVRTTGSKRLRAKYISPFTIAKRVSPTSYELDLPANFKVHPVINIQYLKEFHPNPERFVGRPTDPRNNRLNTDDIVDNTEIEEIRDHRETRLGFFQYLCHYKDTADHDDMWELVDDVNCSESCQRAMTLYWNDFYKWQTKETAKEKKPRKTRKKKEAEIMGRDDEKHEETAEILGRVEENGTVTNAVDNIPASISTASNDPAIGTSSSDHPASQILASEAPAIHNNTDNIIAEAGNNPASTAVNKRKGKKASRKKAPQMAAAIDCISQQSAIQLASGYTPASNLPAH
jgi:hypothetical protein